MQIVINIPDDIYNAIVKEYRKDKELQTRDNLYKTIATGTLLPKGHGRLIDADKMKKKMLYSHDVGAEIELNGTDEFIKYIFNDAPTIIEANKEE